MFGSRLCIVLLDNCDERRLLCTRDGTTLVVFTSRESARAFLESGDLRSNWHLACMDSDTTVDILLGALRNGTQRVVIDPHPHLHRGASVPLLALIEELRLLAKESLHA
jgi:hypothetical protein